MTIRETRISDLSITNARLVKGTKRRKKLAVSLLCVGLILLMTLPLNLAHATLSTQSTSTITNPSGFEGLNETSSGSTYPPDVQVAVGLNHIVEIVNRGVAIYNKQGGLISNTPLNQFFNMGSDWTFDPRVMYDSLNGRWIASVDDNTPGLVKIAFSTSNDPTGSWKLYAFGKSGQYCPDQPRLGISSDKVIVTADQFPYNVNTQSGQQCFGSLSFLGPQYWVLNKTDLIDGASLVHNVTIGPMANIPGSLQPVQSLSATNILYMITTGENATVADAVKVITVSGAPPGTVTNTTTTLRFPTPVNAVPQVGPCIGAPQPPIGGQSFCLDTYSEGTRVQGAAWSQGELWLAFNSGCTPSGDNQVRDCVHLTQINTLAINITRDFDYGAKGQYYFYPALTIDSNQNLDLIYGYSNSTTYPSLAITGQAFNDPSNALAPRLSIKSGSATWTATRWGDYFGAGVDPSNTTVVWVAGEYMRPSTFGGWFSFIASMRLSVPYFAVNPSFSCIQVPPGTSGNETITLASYGFAGTVGLSATVTPSSRYITTGFNPSAVSLASFASGTSILTITTTSHVTQEAYNVTVTGTSGTLSSSAVILLEVLPSSIHGCPT